MFCGWAVCSCVSVVLYFVLGGDGLVCFGGSLGDVDSWAVCEGWCGVGVSGFIRCVCALRLCLGLVVVYVLFGVVCWGFEVCGRFVAVVIAMGSWGLYFDCLC